MKNIAATFLLLFLIIQSAAFAQTDDRLKNGFEADLNASLWTHLPAHYSTGTSPVVSYTCHVMPGVSFSAYYSIHLGKNLYLIPGASYLYFKQRSYYGSNGVASDYGTVQFDNHCVSTGLGIRWYHTKISFENGLNYLYIFKRAGEFTSVQIPVSYAIPVSGISDKNSYLQSYHKLGFHVTKFLGIYASLNIIYGGKKSDALTQYYFQLMPISGIQFLPGISCKFKFIGR